MAENTDRKFKLKIKYLILTPMLSAFVIDYRQQIIPNRLNLTMFEIGLIIAFLYGMSKCSNNSRYVTWNVSRWPIGSALW